MEFFASANNEEPTGVRASCAARRESSPAFEQIAAAAPWRPNALSDAPARRIFLAG
jgi:hypothetical protein